jgi:hypothetical protein
MHGDLMNIPSTVEWCERVLGSETFVAKFMGNLQKPVD